MPLILGPQTEQKDADRVLILPYDAKGMPPQTPDAKVGEVHFYLRTLNGWDDQAIGDMTEVTEKGKTRSKWGSIARERIVRSVIHIGGDGITRKDGTQVETLDYQAYGLLREWILVALIKEINDLNGTGSREKEEGESGRRSVES